MNKFSQCQKTHISHRKSQFMCSSILTSCSASPILPRINHMSRTRVMFKLNRRYGGPHPSSKLNEGRSAERNSARSASAKRCGGDQKRPELGPRAQRAVGLNTRGGTPTAARGQKTQFPKAGSARGRPSSGQREGHSTPNSAGPRAQRAVWFGSCADGYRGVLGPRKDLNSGILATTLFVCLFVCW